MFPKKQRLSKVLAAAGVASRRECEKLIFAGKVKVNNKVILLPQTLVSLDVDTITVGNKKISHTESKVYYLLNKPKGYICSNVRRNQRTKLVLDLFEEVNQRLFTAGRLDKDTTGLLIVTNDGHFANRFIHPSGNIQKEYVVKTDKEILDKHLKGLSQGTTVEGVFVKPVRVKKVRKNTVKIVVMEGKKREVRQLCESCGLSIIELKRTRIGNLKLGTLPVGAWRTMTQREKELIFE